MVSYSQQDSEEEHYVTNEDAAHSATAESSTKGRGLGSRRLDKITVLDIQRFKTERAAKRSIGTVNRDLAVLKQMLTIAVSWGHISKNPASDIKLFRQQEKPMRVLSPEEGDRLITAAAPHLRPIIIVAFNTGMRRGELLGLEWQNVDFSAGVIIVEQTKSGRIRRIPMNAPVRKVLRAIHASEGHVFR